MRALQEHPHIRTPTVVLRHVANHPILIIPANTLYSAMAEAKKTNNDSLLIALKRKEKACAQEITRLNPSQRKSA